MYIGIVVIIILISLDTLNYNSFEGEVYCLLDIAVANQNVARENILHLRFLCY